jgi:hypothetical protein
MPHARFTELNPEENEGITHEYRGDGWRLILGWDIHNDCEPFIQLWYGWWEDEGDSENGPDLTWIEECAGTYRYEYGEETPLQLKEIMEETPLQLKEIMEDVIIPYATLVLNHISKLEIDAAIALATDFYKLR